MQRSNILKGAFVAPSDISLGEYSVLWLSSKKPTLSQRTLERYHSLLKHIVPIADLRLQAVTPSIIQTLYSQLADKLSANTIAKVHKLLGAIFKRALFDDLITKNIMLAVSPPRFEQKDIEIFSQEEVNKIFKFCTTDKNYCRYCPEILLAATTGMRLGEILGLRWQDVNLFNSELNIRKSLQQTLKNGIVLNPPKTKAGLRKIRITPAMVDLLTDLKRSETVGNIDGLVFHTTTNPAQF